MTINCDRQGKAMETILGKHDELTFPWEHEYDVLTVDGKQYHHILSDAHVQTSNSLNGLPLTYRDELHTITDSWRRIYGPLPWHEQAEKYNDGDITVVEKILEKRKAYKSSKLRVQILIFNTKL